ncbi:MAG: OmpA family protein [Sphingomonadales bacterium]|jgi:outer membrane protein OmpA-like peptidoglycan-associated protein
MTPQLTSISAVALLMASMVTAQERQPPAGIGRPDASLSAGVAAAAPQRGPEIRGVITARNGNAMQVTAEDGSKTLVTLDDQTRLKATSGLFGSKARPSLANLFNGIPVTVQTSQYGDQLVATQVQFRSTDYRTAAMIRNATAQQFDAQSAALKEQNVALASLRGRVADIDNYNLKGVTNVYFDTAVWKLSPEAKTRLCDVAAEAEKIPNALLLVVGYTDSVGDDDYNQELSEKRASRVMAHLQQVCRWKSFRTLTPSGMAKADPAADNSTPDGKAQNRRVAVNVLVSKAVDGM